MSCSAAIIILNWNGWVYTRACLQSLQEAGFPMEDVILVDNGSEDGSPKSIAEHFPTVQLLQNQQNLGFTGGNNVGMRLAVNQGYRYIMLLNNDTEIAPGFWEPLLEEMEASSRTAAIQPLIYFLNDKNVLWNAGGRYHSWIGFSQTKLKPKGNAPYLTDWITGCAILVRSSVLEEIGLLDERYFAYFEDVDWSLRMRKAGYLLKVHPGSIIYHEAGAASKSKNKGNEGFLSPKVHFLNVRNQIFQLRKYCRHPITWLSWPVHFLIFGLMLVHFTVKNRKLKRKAILDGLMAGMNTLLKKEA
ncbi:glycosyltransferase family 2 protein [Cyclobacterium plantarum]|uniref:Glycosyltransferase family 2 protein n=1 Tax=Cyclobacterium plantarum TaxID=2716263 RepID=A0ABX0HDG8_9BACT|nr:glycosyltransferase family 2 protein [Cyclobacterium plantarum]NHE58451.1 glycosyltransferase family 2 protein [Cyclobacterium plantarum]